MKIRIQKSYLYEVLVVRAMTHRRYLSVILYSTALFFFIVGQSIFFLPLNGIKKLEDMHKINVIFLKADKRGRAINIIIDDNKTWITCLLNWNERCRLNLEENKEITCYYTYDYSFLGWKKFVWDIRLPDGSLLVNYDYDVTKKRRGLSVNIMAISLCMSVAIIIIIFLINLKDKNSNCKNNI
jgi:hypothetical protein